MTVLNEQESSSINELAGSLRLIQADTASAASEKRREYFQEEISRRLKTVPTANRKRYLEALLTRFPVGGKIATLAPAQPAAAPAQAAESPPQILERFLAAADGLPEDKRSVLAKRLYEAGFAWVDRDALVLEISADLRQKIGIPAGQQPRLNRVVELVVVLVRMLYELDRLSLITLSDLSPKSALLKRSQDFRTAIARFLINENEPIEPQLRNISGLIGGMLAALLGGSRDFGRQFVEKYSPTAIEDVVMGEGRSGFFKGKKELCWDKYCDLSRDIATADLVDRWVKDCLGRFVESKANGGR